MGDSLGAGIVYHLSKNDLSNMTPMEDLNSVVDEPKKNGGNINEGLSTECNERLWTVVTLVRMMSWRAYLFLWRKVFQSRWAEFTKLCEYHITFYKIDLILHFIALFTGNDCMSAYSHMFSPCRRVHYIFCHHCFIVKVCRKKVQDRCKYFTDW